ncbi:translation initiation factor [Acaryochloris sp. IP29b_bin.148]|uniref:translation initiation factor n=1 Tax=Acaryochloris sp. IP29b_bin.148 TaxID=2969218 RepID=UPI002627DC7F|nr:translation initiation factor [Acaryochloris sp. IP29b_bin.148]
MGKKQRPQSDRRVYREFGHAPQPDTTSRPDPPAAQQTLKIEVSRKGRKGKTVTMISGFQAKPETLATLTKKLKAQCGAGGTLKDKSIEVQGDHRQKLADYLQKQGYPVKFVGG